MDHFDLPEAFEAHAKTKALALADRCLELERLGKDVTAANLWQLSEAMA